MAAIPPLHEDPPIGTSNVVPPPATGTTGPQGQQPPAPATPVEQQPPLPADWSPVDPAPAEKGPGE